MIMCNVFSILLYKEYERIGLAAIRSFIFDSCSMLLQMVTQESMPMGLLTHLHSIYKHIIQQLGKFSTHCQMTVTFTRKKEKHPQLFKFCNFFHGVIFCWNFYHNKPSLSYVSRKGQINLKVLNITCKFTLVVVYSTDI